MIQQFVESITKIEPNDSPTTALPPESARIDTRRNLFAYIAEIHFFNLGTYFAPVTTILVALASRLTTDNFLIGQPVGRCRNSSWRTFCMAKPK